MIWLIPILLSIFLVVWAYYRITSEDTHGDYGHIGAAFTALWFFGSAVIGILAVWLVFFMILWSVGG